MLSELLQNAEDSGASWARAFVSDGKFIFEYNGKDFDEDSFRSLCRFGYSNKRSLHTIGFRGIGFKTTFSLGQEVEVDTPSFSFAFNAKRFTLPISRAGIRDQNFTRISVFLESIEKEKAIIDSFNEWLSSPLPLIFFDNLKSLQITDQLIEKLIDKDGPVENSEWVYLSTKPDELLLRIWSTAESFPDECVSEIRQERGDEVFDPAPCKVELVLGASSGRLYTVLPTNVQPNLPFVSNGPFIQDPSRYRIKAPESSPTNDWLLRRVGALARDSALQWLQNESLSMAERAKAYELYPDVSEIAGTSSDAAVARVIVDAFECERSVPVLLCESGTLVAANGAVDVPARLVSIWGYETATRIFSASTEECLCSQITATQRDRLAGWHLIGRNAEDSVSRVLSQRIDLPHPLDDDKLIDLWEYVYQIDQNRWDRYSRRYYPITPISGASKLIQSKAAAFILERDSSLSDDDRDLLLKFLDVADLPFFQRLDKLVEDNPEDARLQSAKQMRPNERPTSMQEAFEQASRKVFSDPIDLENRLELTRFAARHRLSLDRERLTTFRLLSKNGGWIDVTQAVHPRKRDESDLLPSSWLNHFAISDEYTVRLAEEEAEQFWEWLISNQGGIRRFPAPRQGKQRLYSQDQINEAIRERGLTVGWEKRSSAYELEDYDWPEELVSHWENLAQSDDEVWSRVVEALGLAFRSDISKYAEARAGRVHGAVARDFQAGIPAKWLHRLRGLKCLIEERSQMPMEPSLLLRRTPQTEPLLQIEKFVFRNLDIPEMSPLLDALGVRREPKDATTILTRLEALSNSSSPPITNLLDLYRALDAIASASDDRNKAALQDAFQTKALAFGTDGRWFRANEICQGNDGDLEGLPTIHPELRGLRLWDAVQVPKFASFESQEAWIKSIKPFTRLSDQERKRVQVVLGHFPREIYQQLTCWLSCHGEWLPLDHLTYHSVTPSSVSGLFNQIKSATADFSFVSTSLALELASYRPSIEDVIELEVRPTDSIQSDSPIWLGAIAECILRIQEKSIGELAQDQESARLMLRSSWVPASKINVIPQIDGVQAGPEAVKKSLWTDEGVIYVSGSSAAHHKDLAETFVSRFLSREIKEAIRDSIGREQVWIEERFGAQFLLGAAVPSVAEVTIKVMTDQSDAPQPEPVRMELIGASTSEGITPEVKPPAEEVANEPVGLDAANKGTEKKEPAAKLRPLHSFLTEKGFEWSHTQSVYSNPQTGEVVKREPGAILPWTKFSLSGAVLKRFLETSTTLNQGIDIKAEAWMLLETRPELCCIVGPGENNDVFVLEGDSLKHLRSNGWISVAATGYRLRVEADGQSSN